MVYYYWTFPREPAAGAKMLAEAINMMRETNPKNLNLAYMLVDYANRLADDNGYESDLQKELMLPGVQKYHETYRRATIPPTDEDKYQLAERYFKEALPVFREHYKEDNKAIFQCECKLAFVLIKQKKHVEFEEHYQICQQGADKLDTELMRKYLDPIEEVLAENRIQ